MWMDPKTHEHWWEPVAYLLLFLILLICILTVQVAVGLIKIVSR